MKFSAELADCARGPASLRFFKKALLALVLLVPLLAQAGPLAGTVVAISGRATAAGAVLKPGDAVQVGDVIDVGPDAHLQLKMLDQAVISIAPASRVTLSQYTVSGNARDIQLSLGQGLLRLLVPAVSSSSRFEVATATGTAAQRSPAADWFMAFEPAGAQLGVLSGTVALTSARTSRTVSVPTRWGTRLEPGRDPVLPRAWAQVEFDSFIQRTACCTPPPAPPKP
jgi:hypothetical protein